MLPNGILTAVLIYSEEEKPVVYVGGFDDLRLIEDSEVSPVKASLPIEIR